MILDSTFFIFNFEMARETDAVLKEMLERIGV